MSANNESAERLNYFLSSTSAVIYAAKASDDYGATFISDNVFRICGYESQEFTENTEFWIKHIHPEDLEHVHAELEVIHEQGEGFYEYRFLHNDGHYIWIRDGRTYGSAHEYG